MSAHSKTTLAMACLLAMGLSVGGASQARAQATMQGMDMQAMPMPPAKPKPKHPAKPSHQSAKAAPASVSSTGTAHAMQGMDMHAMPTPAKPPATSGPTAHTDAASYPAATQHGAMSGMSMTPAKPAASVDMQHLHFGQMIGTRPKPGGLAGTMGNMSSMQGMSMSGMQGGSAPPNARSPNYSDGYTYGPMRGLDMHDNPALGMLRLDQLEYVHSRGGGNGWAIDGQAWYGRNFNKLWLEFEGNGAAGRLEDLRTEALWSHAVSAFWNTQLGVRHDFGVGPGRTWAAFGIQGLAPYWFDTEAEFYVGPGGRTAARIQVEYEILFTQRLILQPELEANWYGQDDPQRGIGSGLADADVGLRLRYEITRQFAPYVGVVWRQQFGRTADFARAHGQPPDDLQFVAGIHLWF